MDSKGIQVVGECFVNFSSTAILKQKLYKQDMLQNIPKL